MNNKPSHSIVPDPMLHYIMRGGTHPDPRTEATERNIVQHARDRLLSFPPIARRGPRWAFNVSHFQRLWMTNDKQLQDYLYQVRPYPSYIEVELTTACDLRCPKCELQYWSEPPRNMTLEQFRHILDQFPNLRWIGLTGIGQTYLNPDALPIVREVLRRGIYIEQYDSFSHFGPEVAEAMLGAGRIFVSLDAATPKTFAVVHPGADWDRVLANIRGLDALKHRKNSYYPELCFHYIITADNVHEALPYLDFLHSLKLNIHLVQYARMLHSFPEVEDLFVEVPPELQDQLLARGRELGINVAWNADLPAIKPAIQHCTAWTMPFIFVDGTVIVCCALNEGNHREWQRKTSMGNIFEQDFRDIWQGEEYASLAGLRTGNIPEACTRCPIYSLPKS